MLGRISDTYDTESNLKIIEENPDIEQEQILSLFNKMIGEQWQTPPIYSAVRVEGKRLYTYARRGKSVAVPRRKVEVYELDLLEYKRPEVKFRAVVSSGTYIRSLVHSIGEQLGCGAVLSALRRTRICSFSVDNALRIDTNLSQDVVRQNLIKIFDACEFLPRAFVNTVGKKKLAYGQAISNKEIVKFPEKSFSEKEDILIFDEQKNFVAIVQSKQDSNNQWLFLPKRVAITL